MAEPSFKITTKHVIKFFAKEYRMKISRSDARDWLKLWGYTFAGELKEIIAPHLDDIIREATLRDYPNKAFSRFYKRTDEAIMDAADEYGKTIGLENRGESMMDIERCRMVTYLMSCPEVRSEAIFCQNITFLPKGAPLEPPDDGQRFRVHVVVERRRIKARVLAPDESVPAKVRVFDDEARRRIKKKKEARPIEAYGQRQEPLTVH
jgi:hypothetical protein